MNAFSVYKVRSKKHMFVLSAGICRRVADWSIYNTLMWTLHATPKAAFLDFRCGN